MKLSKITASVLSVVAAVGILISAFSGCKKEKTPESDSNYLADVNQYSFWSNTSDTAIAEYNTYHHIHTYLDECEIVNGDAVTPDGKVRKVLFLGFDGMRDYILDRMAQGDDIIC